jgi:hypothetical protein
MDAPPMSAHRVAMLVALLSLLNDGAVAAEPARPNVVFIMADDKGYPRLERTTSLP